MITRAMLTTIDNPHSPFDDFPGWYAYDVSSGYYTSDFLGRMIKDSYELSETDQEVANEQAIDEIVAENVSGIYLKVTREFSE